MKTPETIAAELAASVAINCVITSESSCSPLIRYGGFDNERARELILAAFTELQDQPSTPRVDGPGDKERLDWLERDGHELVWDDQTPCVERATDGERFFGESLRAAIDKAMEGGK
jgi:hypothetical protein